MSTTISPAGSHCIIYKMYKMPYLLKTGQFNSDKLLLRPLAWKQMRRADQVS